MKSTFAVALAYNQNEKPRPFSVLNTLRQIESGNSQLTPDTGCCAYDSLISADVTTSPGSLLPFFIQFKLFN